MTQPVENLLAIETSTNHLMLALSFGSDRLVKSDELVDRSHGQVIARQLENLFQATGLSKDHLHGIVVSTGPGSFTGLRIGLAMAKGIASALTIPVVGVSLYELAAAKFGSAVAEFYVATQVRRDELLVAHIISGVFDPTKVVAAPLASVAQLVGVVPVVGIDVDIIKHVPAARLIGGQPTLTFDASDLLALGRWKLESGRADDLASLEPLYLQKSQAEIRFDQRQRETK